MAEYSKQWIEPNFTGERSACWGYEIDVFLSETRNATYNEQLRNAEGHDPEWLRVPQTPCTGSECKVHERVSNTGVP